MHQPTVRVLKIMEAVMQGEACRLADLSRSLDIPKSTLLPILQTLCQAQYLSQSDDGFYHPGTMLYSMGTALSGKFPLMEFVSGQLRQLVDQVGETCYFGILDGGEVVYLDKADTPQPLRVLITTGRRLPAYATAIGKALLLDKSEEALHELYCSGLEPITQNTVTELPVLIEQLKQAKATGYAYEVEESTEHIRCFAVPVRKKGKIVAAISVAIPVFRYLPDKKESVLAALLKTAQQIGETMEKTNAQLGAAL